MKKLIVLAALFLTLVACSDNQQEAIADTVDDVTGIS